MKTTLVKGDNRLTWLLRIIVIGNVDICANNDIKSICFILLPLTIPYERIIIKETKKLKTKPRLYI